MSLCMPTTLVVTFSISHSGYQYVLPAHAPDQPQVTPLPPHRFKPHLMAPPCLSKFYKIRKCVSPWMNQTMCLNKMKIGRSEDQKKWVNFNTKILAFRHKNLFGKTRPQHHPPVAILLFKIRILSDPLNTAIIRQKKPSPTQCRGTNSAKLQKRNSRANAFWNGLCWLWPLIPPPTVP